MSVFDHCDSCHRSFGALYWCPRAAKLKKIAARRQISARGGHNHASTRYSWLARGQFDPSGSNGDGSEAWLHHWLLPVAEQTRKLGKFRENLIIFIISVFVLQRATTSGVTKPQTHHHWIRGGQTAPLQANCSGLKRGCARREPKFGAAPRFLKFGAWAPIQSIQKHLKTHQKEHCRVCE